MPAALSFKNCVLYLKKLLLHNKESINYVLNLCGVILIYGIIISIILSKFFGYNFDISTILASGLAAYLIKYELPVIISSCFPRQPPVIPVG
jgi:hypothetical protein